MHHTHIPLTVSHACGISCCSIHLPQVALKCADLGHLASPRGVHRQWVTLLEEEMFRQGDRERAAGYPVSPLMDRSKTGITKSQPGFFNFVVLPLFKAFVSAFPQATPMLVSVQDNCDMWLEEKAMHAVLVSAAIAEAAGK